jgi:Eukaryotic and archaeal DNA primase, large subunit
MNHEQFQKNYAYSFRHMYGKEGSRKNYTAFSCMKIIMGTPTNPPTSPSPLLRPTDFLCRTCDGEIIIIMHACRDATGARGVPRVSLPAPAGQPTGRLARLVETRRRRGESTFLPCLVGRYLTPSLIAYMYMHLGVELCFACRWCVKW